MGKRRNASEVEGLLQEFEASGLTRAEFSQRQGIAVTTLDSWRRKRVAQTKLVKVEVQGMEAPPWSFSLRLRSGRRIESAWGFAEQDLARPNSHWGNHVVFGLGPATKIYLGVEAIEMRKGLEGLYGLVRDHLGQDPLSGYLFLFTNRPRTRLKALV